MKTLRAILVSQMVIRRLRPLVLSAFLGQFMLVSGCVSYVGSLAADTLSSAILNQDDPVIIQSGLPAYLLIVDGFIVENPESESVLSQVLSCSHYMDLALQQIMRIRLILLGKLGVMVNALFV